MFVAIPYTRMVMSYRETSLIVIIITEAVTYRDVTLVEQCSEGVNVLSHLILPQARW